MRKILLLSTFLASHVVYGASNSWPPSFLQPGAAPVQGIAPSVVVLRFPMLVTQNDASALSTDYSDKAVPRGNSGEALKEEVIPSVAQTMLTKSTYYGMQLGGCIQDKPGNGFNLILEPSTIGRVGNKWVYSSAPRPVAATVLVDFMTWSGPYASGVTLGTFGKNIEPLITVRTAPDALPSTRGLILVNENWFYIAQPSGDGIDARTGLGAALPEFLNTRAVVAHLLPNSPWRQRTPSLPLSAINRDKEYRSGSVMTVPDLNLPVKREGSSSDAPENADTCSAVISIVRQALADPAIKSLDSARLRSYADSLAASSHGAVTASQFLEHSDVLGKFLQAELDLFIAQDKKLREVLLSPDFVTSFASLREDEVKTARKQSLKNIFALGILAAGTGAGAAGNTATMNANSLVADSLVKNGARMAGNEVNAYSDAYSALTGANYTVAIEGESLQVDSIAALRGRLTEIFHRHYP